MKVKRSLGSRIKGWFPQEPHPSNETRTFQVSIKSSKVLRFSIVFGVLAIIIALTAVYLPFIQQQTYDFAALLVIVIANIVAAYLVHKGVLPKSTNRERMRNLAILAVNLAILAVNLAILFAVLIVIAIVRLLIGGV
jgi:hypothetical protein